MLSICSRRRKFTSAVGVVSLVFALFCALFCLQPAWGASTAEFNAYHNAITQTDPSARAISLELFLKRYPAGNFSLDAEQLLLLAYSETGNMVAALPRAQAVLRSRPSDPTALALLADDEREQIETGATSPSAAQQLQGLATKGLRGLQQFTAPASVSPFEFQRLKTELTTRLQADAGVAALRLKQFAPAQSYLGAAVKQSPNNFRNVYQLALSYLTAIPPDNSRGFAYLAQAAKLASGTAQQQIANYGRQLAAARFGSTAIWDHVVGGSQNPGVLATAATAAPNTAYRSAMVRTAEQPSTPASRPTAATARQPEAPTITRSSTSAAAQSRASVSIGILVDSSVLGRRGSAVRQSLKHVASALSGNDEAFLIDFGNGNTFEQDLTGDPDLLDQAFDSSAGTGRVALYDAIVVATEHLARIARNKKKVLLVLADRNDSASQYSIFQAAGAVENVPNLSLYVIAEGDRKLQQLMADFTRRIAGTAYNVDSANGVSDEVANLMPTILGPSTSQTANAAPDDVTPTTDTATSEGGGIGVVRTSANSASVASGILAQPSYKPLSAYSTLVISGISVNGGQQTAALPGGEDILLEKLLVERLRRQTSFSSVVDANVVPKYPRPPITVSGKPILLSGEITQFEAGPGSASNTPAKMHVRFVFRDATTGREIFTSEDDGEVRGAASDPAGAETETLLRVADSLVREINHNR